METLENWQYALLAAAVLIPVLMLISAIRKAKRRRERDFTRRLETVLRPKEEVKAVCPEKEGRWVLTNERLLLEQGEAFFAVPFERVKKITGVDETGKTTVAAAKMAVLTVKADADHILHRRGDEFTDLVKGLKAGVTRSRKKSGKTTGKTTRKTAGKTEKAGSAKEKPKAAARK